MKQQSAYVEYFGYFLKKRTSENHTNENHTSQGPDVYAWMYPRHRFQKLSKSQVWSKIKLWVFFTPLEPLCLVYFQKWPQFLLFLCSLFFKGGKISWSIFLLHQFQFHQWDNKSIILSLKSTSKNSKFQCTMDERSK